MKRLNELQSLVKMAQSFGQDPDPKILAEIVYLEEQEAKKTNQQKKLKQRVRAAGRALFESAPKPVAEPVIVEQPQIIPEPAKPQTLMDRVVKNIAESTVVNPEPALVPKTADPLSKKVEQLEKWISRIAATGPGGGEVNLRWLDDVARDTIADGRWLKYDGPSKKFVFDEINPYEVIYNTTQVTSATYTVQANDFYLGVNYAGPVTITLPASTNSGRMLIIKDEDGDASTNPITVTGTVDNDAGGFIIQLDNGAIQLIYRNGWRIV